MAKKRNASSEQAAKSERKRAPNVATEIKHYEIHRLLEYPQVKTTSSTASVEFIGEFAPGANIEDEVEQRCGEGWYKATERLTTGRLRHSWIFHARDSFDEYSEQDIDDGQPIK